MAKGNMLLGYSRGSVGDVTFTKIKGQQVARARNRNPHNPRTNKQSLQRAIFAAAVKFYTRGNQNFYKFAFENKKAVESDYNAFMRENVKRAPAISREAFANYDYPVFAPFIMAKGSLPTLVAENSGTNINMYLNVPFTTAPTTVGQLSTMMLVNEQYKVGDIITTVIIKSSYSGTIPSAEATGKGSTTWVINQFVVDPSSTVAISSLDGILISDDDNGILIEPDHSKISEGETLYAACTVHTRNTDSGLKCSTQELVLNTAAKTAYEAAMADAYKQAVIAAWQANGSVDAAPDAILQGSIAYNG